MAVGGGLAIDGPAQVQPVDDGGGAQVEHLLHRRLQSLVAHRAGAEGVHPNGHRPGHADGVGQLHLALVGQPRGHHVLGHPPGGVGGGAVHLGGVLAGEGAAAVGRGAAVCIHDDFPSREAGVPLGPAHHKAAGGVDQDAGVPVQQGGGNGGLHHQFDHVGANLLQGGLGGVLGGEHHRVHPDGPAVRAVLHSDLALAVGPQVVHQLVLAHLGEPLGQLVGQGDGQGHQLLRLPAGVAEHHALVPRAVVQAVVQPALLGLQGLVHAQSDVGGLLVNVGDDSAGVAVKAVLGPVVADVPDHLPGDFGDVHIAGGGDLPHDMDQAGGHRRLAGHPGVGVLLDDGV